MLRRLFLAAGLLATAACFLSTMRVDQTLPSNVGDLTTVKAIEVTTQTGEVLLRGTFSEPSSSSGRIRRVAELTNPENTASRGTAKIVLDRKNGLSDEEIIVLFADLPYPKYCRLLIDGRELTMFTTTEKGKLEFHLVRRVTLSDGK